ncbi:MAG: class I SAM-dependent methyltransferase [Chloroflexi bacterium]|nr:class I SAM-dependent methyltransferase [Chloroflexota bacterium]
MQRQWVYDENLQVGTNYRDDREVLEYDQSMRQIRNLAEEVEIAARALRLRAESTVWEIGTGTGELALGLAVHCSKVWVSDVSPAMLQFARRKAEERGQDNVVFGLGGFLQGLAPDHTVDAVVSQLALHHLPDFWKMAALRRVAAFLNPGGRFYLKDVVFPGDLDDYDEFFSRIIDQVRHSAGEKLAYEIIVHIREEYSTFDWVLEEMLRRAGFQIERKEEDDFVTAYTCIRLS